MLNYLQRLCTHTYQVNLKVVQASKAWFHLLLTQLSQAFVTHFRAAKLVKKLKSYLFTIKQGKDESLKYYIARFNNKALHIEGFNVDMMLNTMMAGLKPGKLLQSLRQNDPKDFQELKSRAQKYAKAEELMNLRQNEVSQVGDKRKKGLSSNILHNRKKSKNEPRDNRSQKSKERFQQYTL